MGLFPMNVGGGGTTSLQSYTVDYGAIVKIYGHGEDSYYSYGSTFSRSGQTLKANVACRAIKCSTSPLTPPSIDSYSANSNIITSNDNSASCVINTANLPSITLTGDFVIGGKAPGGNAGPYISDANKFTAYFSDPIFVIKANQNIKCLIGTWDKNSNDTKIYIGYFSANQVIIASYKVDGNVTFAMEIT